MSGLFGGVRRAAKKNFRVFGGFGRVDLSRHRGNWVALRDWGALCDFARC